MVIVLIMTTFCVPEVSHAETLGDLKNELNKKQDEYNQNEQQKQLTQAEIRKANEDIETTKANIQKTYADLDNLQRPLSARFKSSNIIRS